MSKAIRNSSVGLKGLSNLNKNTNEYHAWLHSKYVAHNYGPYPIAINKGQGIYVWDVEGNKYFDCISGFGSTNQGHTHPEIIKALNKQSHLLQ